MNRILAILILTLIALAPSRAASNSQDAGAIPSLPPTALIPIWGKLVVSGNVVTCYYATGMATPAVWKQIGKPQTIGFINDPVLVGMTICSHDTSTATVSTGTIDNFSITPTPTYRLTDCDIGAPALMGSANLISGVWHLAGTGTNIWGTSDQCNFQPWLVWGDCTVVCRITSISAGNANQKIGIMVRDGFNSGSDYALFCAENGGGVDFQYRLAFNNNPDKTLLVAPPSPGIVSSTEIGYGQTGSTSLYRPPVGRNSWRLCLVGRAVGLLGPLVGLIIQPLGPGLVEVVKEIATDADVHGEITVSTLAAAHRVDRRGDEAAGLGIVGRGQRLEVRQRVRPDQEIEAHRLPRVARDGVRLQAHRRSVPNVLGELRLLGREIAVLLQQRRRSPDRQHVVRGLEIGQEQRLEQVVAPVHVGPRVPMDALASAEIKVPDEVVLLAKPRNDRLAETRIGVVALGPHQRIEDHIPALAVGAVEFLQQLRRQFIAMGHDPVAGGNGVSRDIVAPDILERDDEVIRRHGEPGRRKNRDEAGGQPRHQTQARAGIHRFAAYRCPARRQADQPRRMLCACVAAANAMRITATMRRRAACVVGLVVISTCVVTICRGQPVDLSPYQRGLQRADAALNQTYQQVATTLDPVSRASLKSMQRSWVVFKEADFAIHARILQPDDPGMYGYQTEEELRQTQALRELGKPNLMQMEDGVTTSQQADQILNSVYHQVIGSMPPELVGPEKAAQASWIRFRDYYCQLDAALKGGATEDAVLRGLTMRRSEQLTEYVQIAVKTKLALPQTADGSPGDAEETPTDPPAADPFRFAK